MRYIELKQKHSDEISKFPMFFAFSNEQLDENLKKSGAEKKDIIDIGGGGFLRATDKKNFDDLFDAQQKERGCWFKNDDFMIDAIIYELANHEYCITLDESNALVALDLSLDDARVNKLFKIARKKYLASCEY